MGKSLSVQSAARTIACLAMACLLSLPIAAQQSTASDPGTSPQIRVQDLPKADQPSAQSQDNKTPHPPAGDQGKVAGTSKDRLFYTLPNFLTLENTGKLPPMTAKDKFKVVALGTFDYVQYPWWGLLSAISQAENSEPAFGQGWASYGKRYGTQAADSTIENFMVGAVFPSILHQDPRFYQSSRGGFPRRTFYAVSRIFVTRSDAGNPQFNFSEIFGASTAAAISTFSYHPSSTYLSTPTNPHLFVASDKTIGNAASVLGTQLTLDTITIAVKEFWPDVKRKLSHKSKAADQAPAQ